MPTRGRLVSEYVDDDGIPWRLLVDADYGLDVNRGWTTGLTPGLPPFPRQWEPRRVIGIDPSGRKQSTRIAALDAPLWTGEATAFFFTATDGFNYAATVIARVGERRHL